MFMQRIQLSPFLDFFFSLNHTKVTWKKKKKKHGLVFDLINQERANFLVQNLNGGSVQYWLNVKKVRECVVIKDNQYRCEIF